MNLDKVRGFVLSLGVIALLAAAIAISLTEFRGSVERSTNTLTNESVVVTTGTPKTMANGFVTGISTVYNGSGIQVTSGYTLLKSANANSQINITNTSWVSQTWKVSYTYLDAATFWNVSQSGLDGVDNVMEYSDTWGTIIGVVSLIGIVVGGFYAFKR